VFCVLKIASNGRSIPDTHFGYEASGNANMRLPERRRKSLPREEWRSWMKERAPGVAAGHELGGDTAAAMRDLGEPPPPGFEGCHRRDAGGRAPVGELGEPPPPSGSKGRAGGGGAAGCKLRGDAAAATRGLGESPPSGSRGCCRQDPGALLCASLWSRRCRRRGARGARRRRRRGWREKSSPEEAGQCKGVEEAQSGRKRGGREWLSFFCVVLLEK